MFLGEFQHSIDTKGRLAIPARFRSKIERGAVLDTRGGVVPLCLSAGDLGTKSPRARRRDPRSAPAPHGGARFFGMAFECELDAQGRIIVPARYRQYATLNGEAWFSARATASRYGVPRVGSATTTRWTRPT